MLIVSVALGANFSGILSLTGLNVCYPIGLSLSDNETSDDKFVLWGTLDAAAANASNATNLGVFRGGEQNLPPDIWEVARSWPFLLVQRIAGSTAGSFIAAGDAAASPPVVSVAAPVTIGGYSTAMTLTTFSAHCVRIGGDRNMTAEDVFDIYVSEDATLASSTGAFLAGRICGGGGDGALLSTVATRGYGYCVAKRIAGSTVGNILAYGPAPIGGGGSLSLTTLVVGDTAASGPLAGLSAAATVDIYSSFLAVQTTAGVRATLANPTDATAGKVALVMLDVSSTQTLEMYTMTLNRGAQQLFEWTGAAWVGGKNITPGGNTFGAALNIGSIDAFATNIIANNSVGYSDDGTTNTLGRTAGTSAVTVQAGTGDVNIGANATDHDTNVGSLAGASRTTIQGGTDGVSVQPAATGLLALRSGTTGPASLDSGTTGPVTIGGGAFAKAIGVGNDTGTTSVAVTVGSGNAEFGANATDHTTRVGSVVGASSTLLQAGTVGLSLGGTGPILITPGPSGAVELLPRAAGAGNTAEFRLRELAAGGVNYTGFKAPDALAANPMYTLPLADATIANQALTSNAAGTLAWRGATNVRATLTTGISIADASTTVLVGWTEVTDSSGSFTPATGVFLVPTTGFYFITAQIEYSAIAAIVGAEFTVGVVVAGSTVARGIEVVQVAAANVKRNPKVCIGIQLTAAQSVTFVATQNSGSGANTLTLIESRNYMSIAMVA